MNVLILTSVGFCLFLIGVCVGVARERNRFFRHPALAFLTLAGEGAVAAVGWQCRKCLTIVQNDPPSCSCVNNSQQFNVVYVPNAASPRDLRSSR